ncbi:MAG: DegT/DnrJ/EryC1/StrS family aminotransferase [Chloroflexi bacterium]|nr:DegT/DnrJ/EryC1/StrS family aminotransferase [Chloroflexota bacterium]
MSKKVFDAEDIAAVTRVLESGVLSAGSEAAALEEEFAAALGANHAISCNSAMGGLHAALWAVGVGAGDEMVCDPLVLFGGLAVLYTGAMPVYADVDESTHNMDPTSLAERITPRTKAIIVTHHWGEPADMSGILAVAEAHRLPVIEDCAHVLFGEFQGRNAGTLGSVGVFSFQSSKHLSTGDGGIAVTNDAYLAEQVRAIITFGAAPTRLAHNFRMTEMTAAVARVQLRRARDYVAEDRASAQLYAEAAEGCPWLKPQAASPDSVHAYHLWVAAFAPHSGGPSLEAFREACAAEEAAFSFGYVGVPAYLHPVFSLGGAYGVSRDPQSQPLPYRRGWCPVAESLMPRLMITGISAREQDFHRRNADALQRAVRRLS